MANRSSMLGVVRRTVAESAGTWSGAHCMRCSRQQQSRLIRTIWQQPRPSLPSFASSSTLGRDLVTLRRRAYHDVSRDVAEQMRLPCFAADSSQLSLISSPTEFYTTLKEQILAAQRSIHIASLYIGKGETELLQTLREALRRTPQLKLFVLVDKLRSTREGEGPGVESGASALVSLARSFPGQVEVRLWQTPKLGWIMRTLGRRFNEGAGLQHMKVYAFDDNVIISGANLEKSYFTNRQDRYIFIQRHATVADYMRRLLHETAQFAYKVIPSPSDQEKAPSAEAFADYSTEWPAVDGTAAKRKAVWSQKAGERIDAFTFHHHASSIAAVPPRGANTTIVPLLQMGPYKIAQETTAIPLLFQYLSYQASGSAPASQPRLDLTSGYFSLYATYKALVVSVGFAVRIITAAPISNGFFGSRGVSGYVADAYTRLQIKFWEELKRAGRAQLDRGEAAQEGKANVEIREWKREGWTYHAKGLWLTPPGSDAPHHTLIGSSNFGGRSAELDLECTLLISTSCDKLQRQLKQEVEALRQNAGDVFDDEFIKAERGKPGRRETLFVKVGTWVIRKML